jgi:hypothetical protein
MGGKTVVVVAHRLSTIAHLDRIVVFDRRIALWRTGRTNAELLALGGVYESLSGVGRWTVFCRSKLANRSSATPSSLLGTARYSAEQKERQRGGEV